MSAGIKWFVEIFQEGKLEARIEECGSLREARTIADQAEVTVDFDPSTDSISIYRGESWHTAQFFE